MTEDKDSICCSWYESCTYYMQCEHLYNENKDLSEDVYRLEQENKELKAETLQWKQIKDMANNNKYRSALEEIKEYCSRIERGEVIGTQDCLINSIKNIVNYTINEVLNESN